MEPLKNHSCWISRLPVSLPGWAGCEEISASETSSIPVRKESGAFGRLRQFLGSSQQSSLFLSVLHLRPKF